MASEGVEKYSLNPAYFLFFWIILKNPATGLSFSVD
jgi:hypothetical protein